MTGLPVQISQNVHIKEFAPLPDFRKGGANVVYFSGCRKNNIVVNFSG